MDAHTLDVLDFPRIRELLAEGAQSPQGADLCLRLEPATSRYAAERALEELQALWDWESKAGPPPTSGLQLIEASVDRARVEGLCLDADALLAVRDTLATCHRVLEYLEDAAAEGSLVGGYADRMGPLYELEDRFERTFGPRAEILDGASPRLQQIRTDLKRARERVLKVLRAVLRAADLEPVVQDDFITVRGDRYVVPLTTDFRGRLDGIIHDRSRTGSTFFVEPLRAVELNNELSLLREEEEEEIRRILRELTRWVGQEAPRLLQNLAAAAALDALGARLRLAGRLSCTRPVFTEEPELRVTAARHPLLQIQGGVDVVPIDLLLGSGTRLLLITGANAGGKTVALKTVGLLVLMARAGLFVPAAEGSRIGWFRDLFADIGDEQDIDRNLSTFSAHVVHLCDILERAGPGTLALLDELGTGTDPEEGAALAQAVLDALLAQGAAVAATTHLASLKAFVYARRDATNAAVAFDPGTGRPLFQLVYGYAGSSNALEVAERLGLPAPVLARARAYASAGGDAVEELLRSIEETRERARRSAEEVEALRGRWQERVCEQEAAVAAARRERDAAKDEARAAVREMLDRTREELRLVIAAFSRREASQQEAEEAVRRAEADLVGTLRPERPPEAAAERLEHVAVGNTVFVESLGKDGVVEGFDAEAGRAAVRVGTVRLRVPAAELCPPRGQGPSAAGRAAAEGRRAELRGVRSDAEPGTLEVMVIGCTVEEALSQVDKTLDRSLLAGVSGFRVIHGRGTGTLRRAVREHLRAQPQVREVSSPKGDDALTWAELE
ncbi:MAG: Smr/MutS family protein [Deltaproteobacteria bacterium]|nr:Smr/MutS family protein [Deltaproteobacteria bacterium]